MKFTIEIETDPEEARRFLGLPNLEPMQERLIDQLEDQIARNMKMMDPEALIRTALPLTAQGIEGLQGLFQTALKSVRRERGEEGEPAPAKPKAKKPAAE